MESLRLKKAIFYPTEIVFLRKKGNIAVSIDDIERIEYERPTLLNYILAYGGTFPGRLEIYLKRKINRTKLYFVRIKNKDIINLPEIYQRKIDPEHWRGR